MRRGFLILAVAARLAAEDVEARSPHFRVVGAPQNASTAAVSLERLHSQLAGLGFSVPSGSTEVVLFANFSDMQPYAPPGRAAGFFQQGTDASFLAVDTDSGDWLRALAHEFIHRVLQQRLTSRPEWLREGLADLLSNLQPATGGLKLGLPVPGHLEALRSRRDPAALFYAESWAATHQVVVGQGSGLTLPQRIEALPARLRWSPQLPNPLPAEVLPLLPTPEPEVHVRALPPWARDHQRAELLRARHQAIHARAALIVLRARFPHRPEPLESLGALDMDLLRYDDAERHLAAAVQLGSVNAATHYRYSLLLMGPGHPSEDAVRHARRAVELDSVPPLYWLAQAHAEMQFARWEAARTSLDEVARRAADPLFEEQVRVERAEVERRREQALRPPPKPAPPVRIRREPLAPPAAETPPPPPPAPVPPPPPLSIPGTLTFWGYLRRVECTGEGKILTVANPRFTVRVRERPDHPAQLYSPPRNLRRLSCTLKDVEVNVVYRPLARFGPLNGDLVAVLF